jgi:hypothetical protein
MAKCSECGYLAVRNTKTRELVETEQSIRDTGVIEVVYDDTTRRFHEIGSGYPRYEPPLCFVGFIDLWSESGDYGHASTETIKSAIDTERECNKFAKWQPGFTPKEHWEMIDREARLKWQAEREEADRKWRSKEEWRSNIFQAVIAIVAIILGVILGHFLK